LLERGVETDDRHWARVLRSLGVEKPEDEAAFAFAQSLLHSTRAPSSIVSCVNSARENARQVREQITSEMWSSSKSPVPRSEARRRRRRCPRFPSGDQGRSALVSGHYGFDHEPTARAGSSFKPGALERAVAVAHAVR